MNRFLFILAFLPAFIKAQEVPQKLTGINESEIQNSAIIPDSLKPAEKILMPNCPGTSANNDFVNAITLSVNGGSVAGQVCGTLETNEVTYCNTNVSATVWYKFTAVAATQYVKIDYTSGNCYFGSAVYSGSVLPTAACADNPISCQSSAFGPFNHIHQLTGLTIGNVYYIQVINGSGICLVNQPTFNIGVTTANPGGFLSNPPTINNCSAPGPGCYFNSPPSVATVTSSCPGYALNANGYAANSVWSGYFQFTNSPSFNSAQIQAILTTNCGAAGNVNWFNWSIYSSGCGLITCGTISNLSISGLACGGSYIIYYQMEFGNCGTFTTIWPYQNAPSGSGACTPLPIELLYFTASAKQKDIYLEWKTVSERQSKEFVLEKSADGINYKKLVTVASKGPSDYSYIDKDSDAGTHYYRLLHIDADGETSYSKSITILTEGEKEILRIAPNPGDGASDILFSKNFLNALADVEVYSLKGLKVFSTQLKVDQLHQQLDLSTLEKGLYTIIIRSHNSGTESGTIRYIRE